ncbi:MAG: SET domain-containing protein [Nitrospirae bacterium]|nr:SET domain-containing protein [Nitrospirota bacterium]
MLKVDAVARPSEIHGLGLFAQVFIPAGTVIWEYAPPFDVVFTEAQLRQLSQPAQRQVLYYAAFDSEQGAYLLSGDDDRFINHSDTPTAKDGGHVVVALMDIPQGAEITLDYREIGSTFRSK